jgi:hypothetical protein
MLTVSHTVTLIAQPKANLNGTITARLVELRIPRRVPTMDATFLWQSNYGGEMVQAEAHLNIELANFNQNRKGKCEN